MKTNDNGECIVEHHTKYKEIHGVDETVWMTQADHLKLHYRLRKEGKCSVSVDHLNKISKAAQGRTDKNKLYKRTYKPTDIMKKYYTEYHKKNIHSFDFYDRMMKSVRHYEHIQYNNSTGNISINCGFMINGD